MRTALLIRCGLQPAPFSSLGSLWQTLLVLCLPHPCYHRRICYLHVYDGVRAAISQFLSHDLRFRTTWHLLWMDFERSAAATSKTRCRLRIRQLDRKLGFYLDAIHLSRGGSAILPSCHGSQHRSSVPRFSMRPLHVLPPPSIEQAAGSS